MSYDVYVWVAWDLYICNAMMYEDMMLVYRYYVMSYDACIRKSI